MKKLNRFDYIFQNKKGETLIKKPGDINGIDFYMANLENCEVFLMDHTAQVYPFNVIMIDHFIGYNWWLRKL